MTRLIARMRISFACLAIAAIAAPVGAADPTAAAPQSVEAAAAPASPALPSTEMPAPSTEGPPAAKPQSTPAPAPSVPSTSTPSGPAPSSATPSVEALPPGTTEAVPTPDTTATAPQAVESSGPQPIGPPACETPAHEGIFLHPLAGRRANFAATHNAPARFPYYDGQPRPVAMPVVVPGARVAAFVQGPHPVLARLAGQDEPQQAIEQPLPPGAAAAPEVAAPEVAAPEVAAPEGDEAAAGPVVGPSDGPPVSPGDWSAPQAAGWFGGSDYFFVRPHQTYDAAYQLTPNGVTGPGVTNVNFNPSFGNGVRLFAGYETACDESIRFGYTYLYNDTLRTVAVPTGSSVLTPLGATLFPGDALDATEHLLVNVWDIDDSRKLNLGWCECKSCCPSWDVSWSWGVRIIDIEEAILNSVTGPDAGTFTQKSAFLGAGPKLGIDVRRHLGHSRFSAYVAADAALLLGEEKTYGTDTPSGSKGVQAVPNFDVQLGLEWRPTCHISITSGYLFEYFGDATQLSEAAGLALLVPPQASNLSFDGFFVRGEFKY